MSVRLARLLEAKQYYTVQVLEGQKFLRMIEASLRRGVQMPKQRIAEALTMETGAKKPVASKFLDTLCALGTKELKTTGAFTIPGLIRLKTSMKKPTKAGKRDICGKAKMVTAKPSRKIAKAFLVRGLAGQLGCHSPQSRGRRR